MSSMRTPLGRVRGHGAAKSGAHHFIGERVSAIGLLLLAPWFAIAAALSIRTYEQAIAFVRAPVNAIGLILLIAVAFYHMRLGMQVIIDDYIAKPATRAALQILNYFFCTLAAVIGLYAVLQINFGW